MTKTITRLALVGALFVSMTQVASADATYKEGSIAISARAGIAPTSFSKKTKLTTTASTANAAIPAGTNNVANANVLRQSQAKGFSKLHSLPFTMGFDAGYFLQDDLELFVNFDYARASGKKVTFNGKLGNLDAGSTWKIRSYTTYGGYVGARNYFCASGSFLPFVGAKIGMKRNGGTKAETITGNFKPDVAFKRASYKGCTGFSGGVQFGFDYVLADNYALTFMSEIIGTSGKRFSGKQEVHQTATAAKPVGLQSQVTRNPSGSISFPVTLGVRFRM